MRFWVVFWCWRVPAIVLMSAVYCLTVGPFHVAAKALRVAYLDTAYKAAVTPVVESIRAEFAAQQRGELPTDGRPPFGGAP